MYKNLSFVVAAAALMLAGCQQEEAPVVQGKSTQIESAQVESAAADVKKANTLAPTAAGKADSNPVATDYQYGTMTRITADHVSNRVSYIPPQCYTNPVDSNGVVSNPCYACHTESKRPNFLNDIDVQLSYNFPESGVVNNWTNLFKDRTTQVAAISDAEIQRYVREDNYFAANGGIILAAKLANPPAEWDRNGDGQWGGYVPDAWFHFDEQGFDIAPNGDMSGWRVFAYYPFPGTFMPTNGSTDDVMIRLPEMFRQLADGTFDRETYIVNLAIVEAMMKETNIQIEPVDESRWGVDLDKNGSIGMASQITYDWAPKEKRLMSYVGAAKAAFDAGTIKMAARMFPTRTEFLHSVRYVDVNNSGSETRMAPRMKELRYSIKKGWSTYFDWRNLADDEFKERHDFPDRAKTVYGNMEEGVHAKHGWLYQGFIEDDAGQLRPQSYQENVFCLGCHGYIGAHNDTVLSFNRKFDNNSAFRRGWYHWSEKGFAGVADPHKEDGSGEYAFYLQHNPTGNEYRTNDEVHQRFFDADGKARPEAFERLSNDISYLLMPSPERAMELNKAYRVIVQEQSYNEGRDPVIKPLTNVHKEVTRGQETGITEVLNHY